MADLAWGRVRAKLPQLRAALQGQIKLHHRVLLQQIRAPINFLETAIAQLEGETRAAPAALPSPRQQQTTAAPEGV